MPASRTISARGALDAFLRAGGSRTPDWESLHRGAPVVVVVIFGGIYGATMAGYGGFLGDRLLMVAYGVAKIPLLFGATLLLAVPSFYVLNLLLGVGDDFPVVWRALVDYQIAVALQLGALVPVTLFINLTEGEYRVAQGWSILVFGLAAWNARRSLGAAYAILAAPVHRWLRRFWFFIYAFVGIQMGWVLRPFVGHPDMPVQFLRDQIGNAYVEVAGVIALIVRELAGG